jgi:hypothetical protein
MSEELTHGGRLVGMTFNPSGDRMVAHLKGKCAEVIDCVEAMVPRDVDHADIIFEAKMRALDAQMWAVKAATWRT